MENTYCVYKHTCIKNGKIYIGITKTSPKRRWINGSGYKHNEYFYRAIKKYGWNKGFVHEILFEKLSKDEAEKKAILQKLGNKYAPLEPPQGLLQEIDSQIKHTNIIVLTIEHISGKEAIELVKAKK